MRTLTLAILVTVLGAVGGGCPPLIDLDAREVQQGALIGVSLTSPSATRTVREGATVAIDWTASNVSDEEATVTIFVENRADLTRTVLTGGEEVGTGTARRTVSWDTTGFGGATYSIRAEIRAETRTSESTALGRITVDAAPSFEFTAPAIDVTLPNDGGDDDIVTIRWAASDAEAQGRLQLGLDPDAEHASGNEIFILERDLRNDAAVDSLNWNGDSSAGDRVEMGTYFLFALVDDEVNEPITVEATGRITVPSAPMTGSRITAPMSDTTFLTSDASTRISWVLDEATAVQIDIKLDTDDNNTNGNERTILSQRFQNDDVTTDFFDWTGTDSTGAAVADGIYRVVLVIDRGNATPGTIASAGLLFRRSTADQPLIAMQLPGAQETLSPGNFLRVRWRDEDPGDRSTVTIVIDDDNIPAETTETGAAEITILASRAAKDDDVNDTFSYQIPSTLPPATYSVFGYIDNDSMPPAANVSIAPGRLIIPDPNP